MSEAGCVPALSGRPGADRPKMEWVAKALQLTIIIEWRGPPGAKPEPLEKPDLLIRHRATERPILEELHEAGLPDLASLTAMLIQTDRFGTSVAQALRIHADTMRTKRRQRAEEAAAKTTIKLIFPLVFCIFPALFVVILGPAVIQIMQALKSFG